MVVLIGRSRRVSRHDLLHGRHAAPTAAVFLIYDLSARLLRAVLVLLGVVFGGQIERVVMYARQTENGILTCSPWRYRLGGQGLSRHKRRLAHADFPSNRYILRGSSGDPPAASIPRERRSGLVFAAPTRLQLILDLRLQGGIG